MVSLVSRHRGLQIWVAALAALVAAVWVAAAPSQHADASMSMSAGAPAADTATADAMSMGHGPTAVLSTKAVRFHDHMRKLWEDHVTWTRLAIVTFADGSAGFDATAARLLKNQQDIGDAIKPYYGKKAGNQLAGLLHDHITIAVEVLQAAKAGDTDAFNEANKRWYANARQIADFLHAANPHHWGKKMMRADMKVHLDQTLAEAADELGGKYKASVHDYDAVHHHILAMADMLSSGIVAQFPKRFR
jgi:hypothetical protein